MLEIIVSTPRPNAVFAAPTNGAWPNIYQYYWETIVPLSLLLWALSLGLVIFLESTSHLFSGYHRAKLKKRAFSGLVGILSWWWIAALSLRFVDSLAKFLLPNLSNVALFETASFGVIGVLGVAISLTVDLALFVIVALLYYLRQVVLYLFVLLMPILIAFWVPGVGPFTYVSRLVKQLAGYFVPFLFMTVPVALLFRLGQLLGSSATLTLGGIGRWIVAIATPVVAVLIPFVLFWQASALFFMAERAGHHTSARRARSRVDRVRSATPSSSQGGQNFVRGLRGDPAVRGDGQTLLGSGKSRAHAAGARLHSAGGTLRQTLGTGSGGSGQQATLSDETPSRNDSFDALRSRERTAPDDEPRSFY